MGCCCCKKELQVVDVNAHLHTPYSFSAFETLNEALERASNEGVKVVGINDFYTVKGYSQWYDQALKLGLYPLFNIEFISLQAEDQAAGLRVNDPGNPGRTYLSGKGLSYPVNLTGDSGSKLEMLGKAANEHSGKMCAKMNQLLEQVGVDVRLDLGDIEPRLTKGMIRERHLAKALRIAVAEKSGNDTDAMKAMFEKIFGGVALKSDVADFAGVENEIRGNLLKAGGAAFVAEDPAAFLPMSEVCKIILDAGGIPTYPFLADDAKGGFTDFEGDVEQTARILKCRGIYSVEFITTRNSIEVLERYAGYLHDEGFVVTFGSEHNTPAMEPILLAARGGVALTEKLRKIAYQGACVVAAHQELVRAGKLGYLNSMGVAQVDRREEFIREGDKAIKKIIG